MNCRRRIVFKAAMIGMLSPYLFEQARAQSKEKNAKSSPLEDNKAKREFIERARTQWKQDYAAILLSAKEDQRRGVLSSLSPPRELIPFKDWDYYYVKGSGPMWFPNKGQPYTSVVVPVGFVTDLASIPQWVWSSGLRPEGAYAYAAIVHDYLYWVQTRPREEANEIFLFAMQDSKVDSALRKAIYEAVTLAGKGAWDNNAKLKKNGEKRILKQFPDDFTITWKDFKVRPGVFVD